MASSTAPATYQGNDRLLFGLIMGVIAFWLFAQTTLNIAPDMSRDLGVTADTMNIAVAITALFSGIFIIVMGGLADRVGRMKIVRAGFYLNRHHRAGLQRADDRGRHPVDHADGAQGQAHVASAASGTARQRPPSAWPAARS